MQTGSSINSPFGTRNVTVIGRIRRVLLRKIWLPRFLYEALPYIDISCGLSALYAAAHATGWALLLPYVILVGLISLHAGIAIATMRYRFRTRFKKTRND